METPPPTPAPKENEEQEEEQEEEEEKESGFGSDEGELDSVGYLFQTLLDNDTAAEQCSFFNPNLPNAEPEDNPADKNPSPSSSHSQLPLHRTRSDNIVAKVPYSRFISDPRYASYAKHLVQDTEQQTSKKPKTHQPSCTVSNTAGIPNISISLELDRQKTPSASHPLAGKIRTPKSHSLTTSSSYSMGTPDDFQINAG